MNEVGLQNAIRFLTVIGRNKRAERGQVSLFGHHLTIQEFTQGVVAFMYVTCGREKKSCVAYNRGEILVRTPKILKFNNVNLKTLIKIIIWAICSKLTLERILKFYG